MREHLRQLQACTKCRPMAQVVEKWSSRSATRECPHPPDCLCLVRNPFPLLFRPGFCALQSSPRSQLGTPWTKKSISCRHKGRRAYRSAEWRARCPSLLNDTLKPPIPRPLGRAINESNECTDVKNRHLRALRASRCQVLTLSSKAEILPSPAYRLASPIRSAGPHQDQRIGLAGPGKYRPL
jgi:hypothetical protein